MTRQILSCVLALAAGAASLMAQKQPQPKSQKEVEAIQAMFSAPDPDSRIKAADDLIKKFADTEFKAIALQFAAASYQQKNDFEKMVTYAELTLEADPKNYMSMLMLASGIAQRTREHDLDREEKLARSEKYAKTAMEVLKGAPKPNPQITDEQWAGAVKDFMSQAHEALGLGAMARKKYDVAVTEFKAAVEGAAAPDPAAVVRLAQAYNLSGKPDDALAAVEKVNTMADVHPSIKQFAQAERVRAMQAKGGAPKPPAAPPPPQIEVKKP